MHALNPAHGTQYWEGGIGQSWVSSPVVAPDGTVYAALGWGNHRLFAYNPDGTLKCNSTASSSGFSGVAVDDDAVYFGGPTELFAVNPDGSTLWSYPTGDRVDGIPTVADDGTIYFGSDDDSFYALNSNGTLKWSYATGADIACSAAIGSDGTIYVGSDDGKLYAFNSDGTLKWSYDTAASFAWSCVSIDGGGTIYSQPSATAKVYALNSDGALKWSYDVGGGTIENTAVAIGDGVLYVSGGGQNNIIALHPWTLSATTNPPGLHPNNTMTITATTSMLQTDPSNPGENNQVQAVMPNGDKVALSYNSTNANGETVWTGTWTVPAGTPLRPYTSTIEAAAYNVQTDTPVHFASPPTGSNDTGITNTFSYRVVPALARRRSSGGGTVTGTQGQTPPQIILEYTNVHPQQQYAGQPVTITTNASNIGGSTGQYDVTLVINGQVEETSLVSVGAHSAVPVKFTVTRYVPGTYTVTIGGQQSSFTIVGASTGSPASGGLIAMIVIGILVFATVVGLVLAFRRPA